MGLPDEVNGVAQIDDLDIRQLSAAPSHLRFLDRYPCVSVEEQHGDVGLCQPLPVQGLSEHALRDSNPTL